MDSSPNLLEEISKYKYVKTQKSSLTENHSAAPVNDSKMKALIGEVSVRWQQQKLVSKKLATDSHSEEDMFIGADENDEDEPESSENNIKKNVEMSKKVDDDATSRRSSSPELKTDDDYEPSSADSSDSESKEWLNKEKLKAAKKRSYDDSYRTTYENIKRRRVDRDSDEDSPNENERLMKCKNSFEMLKNLRQMRLQKILEKNKTKPVDETNAAASSTESVVSCNANNFLDDVNGNSADQNSDASLNRMISTAISETIDEIEKKKINQAETESNRKHFVVDSESESESKKSNDDDDKFESPKPKRTAKRIVLMSSDEEGSGKDDGSIDADDDDGDSDDSTDHSKPVQKSSPKTKNSSSRAPKKLKSREIEEKALNFFDDATLEELTSFPRINERVAEALIALRPFETFDNLVDSIKNAKIKGVKTMLVDCYVEMLELQNDLDRLLYSCACISKDLNDSVNGLLNGVGRTVRQPKTIEENLELKPYQIVGLNWLVLMNKQNLNCILADEMGLGKTIEVIAFLAYLKENNVDGPHLIVVPSSTMDNWLNEFRRWCSSLNVLTYYGSLDDRKFVRNEFAEGNLDNFDVILTTYRVVTSNSDDKAFFKRLHLNYSIYDEAHMLKNSSTARYRSLMKIKSQRRLLLTGTPLQNNLIELISLMHFVMPNLFLDHTDNLRDILNLFQCKSRSMADYEREKIEQAKNIMRPFVLRRLKSEVLEQLPKKHERIEFCELDGRQLEIYGNLVSECAEAVKKTDQGFSNKDALSFLMQLRKAANHPLLLRRLYDDEKLKKMSSALCKEKSHRDANPLLVVEDMSIMSDFELSKMCNNHRSLSRFKLAAKNVAVSAKFQVLDRLLPEQKSQGNKVLLFSQFVIVLDIMEHYLNLRKYKYLRLDGSTPVVERQILIDKFNSSPDLFIFLLSTKAGGLGINLTSANVIILHDIDYNPYNDRQAEDRCHRVGQTKEVTVIRLIAKNTIDESMLACAQRKLLLEKQVTAVEQGEDEEDPKDIESLLKQALGV